MSPQWMRAVFLILVVRAIFLSPVPGAEFGRSSDLNDSSLKSMDATPPFRLRFTRPCVPSATSERLDCIDGGDGDDSRIRPSPSLWEVQPLPRSLRPIFPAGHSAGAPVRGFVRLRC